MDRQNIIIYKTTDGKASVALYAQDGEVWSNQKQLAELFATSKSTVNEHITNILKEKELNENSVVRNFRTTAADGKNYSGDYVYLKNGNGQYKLDKNEHLIVQHDLHNHDGELPDGIAEAFIEWAKGEQLSFWI